MMRFVRVVPCVVLCVLALAAPGRAQTAAAGRSQTPAAGSETSPYYVEANTALTFGHTASGSFGGEFGMKLRGALGVFVEGGYMIDVGTSDLDARVQPLADLVGATFDAAYKVGYFDGGVRYTPNKVMGKFHPYVNLGIGWAHVRAKTEFAVNGSTVPPESLGILLGDDLNGSVNKFLLTLGGGVIYPFADRYFVDGTYRYGVIFPSGALVDDKAINTNRLQIGVGLHF
jgi:opacity protein-like surface antigen